MNVPTSIQAGLCQVRPPSDAKTGSVLAKPLLGFSGMLRDPCSTPVGLFGMDE